MPQKVHNAMLIAPAKAKYFNKSIRGKFAYQGIELKQSSRNTKQELHHES
jgi:hypothetical protein